MTPVSEITMLDTFPREVLKIAAGLPGAQVSCNMILRPNGPNVFDVVVSQLGGPNIHVHGGDLAQAIHSARQQVLTILKGSIPDVIVLNGRRYVAETLSDRGAELA